MIDCVFVLFNLGCLLSLFLPIHRNPIYRIHTQIQDTFVYTGYEKVSLFKNYTKLINMWDTKNKTITYTLVKCTHELFCGFYPKLLFV